MNGLLYWLLSCVLFLMAVACAVFGAFVRGDVPRYLSWAALGA